MDALGGAFLNPISSDLENVDDDTEVIIEQEEKIINPDGTVKIKQRTLKNPSKEEIETKTLDELEDDEDDPV